MSYQDIRLPIKYSGRKNEGLGNVIYDLVELSKASTFVDMFGGAGYASMAASQVNGVKEILLNDIDPVCRNFYEVMMDDELFAKFKESYDRIYNSIVDSSLAKIYMRNAINEMNLVLSQGIEDKVDSALMFAYYNSYKISGGKSEVGAVIDSSLKRNKKSYSASSFDIVHDLLKKAKVCNCNMFTSLDILEWLLSNENAVYYSDSPYLFTEGYNVEDITAENMNSLINVMTVADKLQKSFIFSCRCGMTINSDTYTKWGSLLNQSFLTVKEVNTIKKKLLNPDFFFEDYNSFETYKASAVIKDILKKVYNNQVVYDLIIDRFAKLDDCKVVITVEVAERDMQEKVADLVEQYLCSFKRMELFYTNISIADDLILNDYKPKEVKGSEVGRPKYCKYVIMTAKDFRDLVDKCMLKFPDADKKKVVASKTEPGCYVK